MLKEIREQLDTMFCAYEDRGALDVWTHMTIEGDPINFRFYQEDNKYARLVTPPCFSEWMAYSTGCWSRAASTIEALAEPYGVSWDNENGALYIRFRRNEMSVAEAIMRLQQAVSLVCELGPF
ncbi:MAG: hypothetical protein IJC84_02765 [Clostridia bacterium]|nr:hypothetical protein [Clostridia bacterium]